jgi:hypothetical protein
MRTLHLLLLSLSLSSAALAQEFPPKGPATGDPNENASRPKTYQGCVIRANKTIMLADQSNRDYKLVGDDKSLESYIGKEVRITATDVNTNDPSSDERSVSGTEPQNAPKSLSVENIEKVSDYCSSPK